MVELVTETIDGFGDVAGGLRLLERLRVLVVPFDEGVGICFGLHAEAGAPHCGCLRAGSVNRRPT